MFENSRRLLVLNLYLPIGLALYNSVGRALPAMNIHTFKAFIIFIVCSLPVFFAAYTFSVLALGQVKKTQLPRYLSLILGAALAIVFSYFYLSAFALVVWHWVPWLKSGFSYDFSPSIGGFFVFLRSSTSLLFAPVWVCANFIYEYASKDWLYFQRSERIQPVGNLSQPETIAQATAPQTGFLSKIPPELGKSVVALEAQEHYVRVYTSAGSDLILYRFGDAVTELEASALGVQVHRSYLIDPNQIIETKRSGRSMVLVMSNGLNVPVSRSYRALVSRVSKQSPERPLQSADPAATS
jgi:hypothetical protein